MESSDTTRAPHSVEMEAAQEDAASRARELRRRVANRRRNAVSALDRKTSGGAATSSTLLSKSGNPSGETLSLPQLFFAKHEAHGIRMEVIDMHARQNATLKACDQQFVVEGNVRHLRKGIGAAQLQIRQKGGELDELQRRVIRLSKSLHDTSDERAFAKTKLASQEEIRKQQLDARPCQRCGRAFLPAVLTAHEGNCMNTSFPRLSMATGSNQLLDRLQQQPQLFPAVHKALAVPATSFLPRFVSQPPRNLRIDEKGIAHNAISMSWMEPLDDGGKPIQDYELTFLEAIITVDGEKASANLDVVCRSAPGNEFKQLDELQAAMNTRSHTVDSQFLSGFMQRYERHHYIEQVSRFILAIHPELEAKVNAILDRTEALAEAMSSGTEHEETAAAQASSSRKQFDDLSEEEKVAERRRQFHFRIAELRSDLKKAEYNVQWCKDRRIDLVALIRAAETRIIEKQSELERAKMFRGPQMDSDVLENGLQRFFTKELILALEDEIEIDQLYILDSKTEIVKVENYLRADSKRRDTVMKRLDERQHALEAFESNTDYVGEANGTTATLAKLRGGLLYRAFAAFVQNRMEAHEVRRKMKAAANRLVTHRVRSAVQRWREVAKYLTRQNAGIDAIWGIGSIGLLNASIGRDDLLLEAQQVLQQLRSTDTSLRETRWTKEQQAAKLQDVARDSSHADQPSSQTQDKKYYPYLLEGDAKMDLQEYESALCLYNVVFSSECLMQQMDTSQIVRLQLKIGEATFRLENHEHALAVFNRVSILASRAGLRYEEGSALLRLADVQCKLRSLQLSIESYEHALLSFEAVGDVQGELACYRGLQKVYSKLEDRDMVDSNKQRADEIEFVLAKKLAAAGQQLSKLQLRLVGAGAESSREITLERVGPIVPRLRRERIQHKLDICEEIKLVSSLEKLLVEKKILLAKGEDDLKRALASDSSQVDSTIISGSDARYDIEDFKKKLAKLLGSVKVGEEQIGKEIMSAKIRISNAEDEIQGLEKELAVETGALMRKIVSRDKIRCFRFNATNEALKNVVGTASHGYTTCFSAAGLNGSLYDLLSGACLAQAVGDPHKNHLGAPTGHQAQILCVYHIGSRVYTGSVDASLGAWDVANESIGGFSCSLVKMLTEFDAAVVSVVADTQWLACGCSDCDVFIFDTQSLVTIVRIISAHERSVTALSVNSASATLTTGATDNRVKVWEFDEVSLRTTRRKATLAWCLEAERRGDEYFNGHLAPVTCVRRTGNEIVSGDSAGRVVIWNLDADSKLLRICDVHRDVAVTCLQFDATRIVSGASTGEICVTDFATGNLIQTLHGHQDSVLDLQFDRKRLVSVSADGKLHLWFWQTRDGIGADRKKYHILGAGETLRSLSLKYRTSVQSLLRWNSVADSTKLYLGQKLIVEVDANTTAADELKTLDLASSVLFGKLSYEDLDFVAANQVKSKDVESQWAAQRLAMLAKEYFPRMDDEEDSNVGNATVDEEEDDGSDVEVGLESKAEGDGGIDEGEED
ncbi:hypothetical protein BBJ28_00004356 [Nothophytophthora sp. Chile5]|nr:hypothetical protein BBJ28_00004356 [Nothophytophthora sp. Chile5]